MAVAIEVLDRLAEEYKGYRDDPVAWSNDVLDVELWSKQEEILDSVFKNIRTAVRACHSSGKTFIAADAVLAFLLLLYPSKVVTTAPTWRQVRDLLWSEINRLFTTRLGTQFPNASMLNTRLEIEKDWFALGVSANDPVTFQGFHQDNVLLVFDESPGVRPEVIEGAESLMASGNVHMLHIGNPTESSGHFYDAFHREGASFNKIHIPYSSTPNFTDENVSDELKQRLISRWWVEDAKTKWGEASPLFISRCHGDFPPAVEGQVISLTLCEAARNRDVLPEGEAELGVDVGAGGDLSAYAVKRGNVIVEVLTDNNADTMAVAGKCVALHHKYQFRRINIDKQGVGVGAYNRLMEQGLPVIGVTSSGPAVDGEQYADKRTEQWYNMRDWLQHGRIPDDDELIADLTGPRLDEERPVNSKGQLVLEPKKKTKKRLKRSPDRGDAVVYAIDRSSQAQGPGIY